MLSGENSILNQAGKARDKTGEKQIDEEMTLAVNGAMANGLGKLNYDNLNSELKRQFGEENYTINPQNDAESWIVTATENGITRTYTIYASGKMEVESMGTIQISFNPVPTESRAVILEVTATIEGETVPTESELQSKSQEELQTLFVKACNSIGYTFTSWNDVLNANEYSYMGTVQDAFNYFNLSQGGYSNVFDFIIKTGATKEPATFTLNGETITGLKGEFLITENGNYTVTATKGNETGTATANVTNCVNRTDNKVETYSNICPTNTNLKIGTSGNVEPASSGDTVVAVCPAGFAYGTSNNVGTVAKGLVITDAVENGNSIGNEFVWIPVDKANLTVGTTNKKMAQLKSGSSTDYRGVVYKFENDITGSTTYEENAYAYNEPAYLTDSSYGDASSSNHGVILTNTLQDEYNAMIRSVKQYGGFYVGRYEMGKGNNYSKLNVETTSASRSDEYNWYGLYRKAKSYDILGVTAGMIWGSQYDAMINFGLTNSSDASKVTANTNGNHTGRKLKTGTHKGSDSINNIFDLEGNMMEWTKGAGGTQSRIEYSGSYVGIHRFSPIRRYSSYPKDYSDFTGCRISIYINT